ncbi:nuclease-related domain-containing protein [Bacillus sp. SG-1]|uniref:nuclease-related domain-containing protein n=1 Tax=Bacillus sp. SG-1 TaxID=161544 RepID=UPI0002D7CF6F|nr:nuclease-related domain-containing protein [Bacillus sp. SG-1]
MIVKNLSIPLRILQNEALLNRLHEHHPKRELIEADNMKRLKGYRGEQALDYYLSFLAANEFYILHGLRLQHGEYFFQIDLLLVSPLFLLVVEIKNISGTVILGGPFKQMIRIKDNIEEGFNNPLTQVKRQKYQLQEWLAKYNYTGLPIEHLVVFSNSSTIIRAQDNDKEVLEKVCHANQLIEKINSYKSSYNRILLEEKKIKKMCRVLKKHHIPKRDDILQTYGISQSDIIQGVICPECSFSPMIRLRGSWSCPSCKLTSTNAHHKAIKDFLYLMNPTISNQQTREFLKINSRTIASKLLKGMNLHCTGNTKGTYYSLPE